MPHTLQINGRMITVQAPGTARVLDVLRDELGLTGTKEGCGKGECGACAILMDGQVVNSCLLLVSQAEGHALTTIEGLAAAPEWQPLFDAFVAEGAVQCGFCMPGMAVAAAALLQETPRPTEEEIIRGISGNLCRCTGYRKIIAAIKHASEIITGSPK